MSLKEMHLKATALVFEERNIPQGLDLAKQAAAQGSWEAKRLITIIAAMTSNVALFVEANRDLAETDGQAPAHVILGLLHAGNNAYMGHVKHPMLKPFDEADIDKLHNLDKAYDLIEQGLRIAHESSTTLMSHDYIHIAELYSKRHQRAGQMTLADIKIAQTFYKLAKQSAPNEEGHAGLVPLLDELIANGEKMLASRRGQYTAQEADAELHEATECFDGCGLAFEWEV